MTGGARSPAAVRVQGGIDEAGLGPMLGPLTLGLVVLELPAEGSQDPWELLASAVAPRPEGAGERLVVADSKVVFARSPAGHARLERTALAFLAGADRDCGPPRTGAELLARAPRGLACPEQVLARHPWYERLGAPLPAWTTAGDLERPLARLHEALAASGVRLLEAFPRLVTEGELNASYAETDNKSVTTWRLCADLIAHFWNEHGEREPELVVDRQGGRLHYASLLWEHLPDTWIETRREGRAGCEYVVHGEGRRMRVLFRERAEEVSFAVALASCLAKYLRELSMAGFNSFFTERQDGLRPTAGYVTDARRWLAEAAPALAGLELDPGVLVRER